MSSFALASTVPAPAGALVGAPPLLPPRPSASVMQSVLEAYPEDLSRASKRTKRKAGDLDDLYDPTAADGLGKRTCLTGSAEFKFKTVLRETPPDKFHGEWVIDALADPQRPTSGLRKYMQICDMHGYEHAQMERGMPIEETGMLIDDMARLVISNPSCIKEPDAVPYGQFWGGSTSDSCEVGGKHLKARKPMKKRQGKKQK